MRPHTLLILSLATAAMAGAQEPIRFAAPLLPQAPSAPSPGEDALVRTAAERAQALGFPSVAVELYREMLAKAPGPARPGLALGLATSLLDDNQPGEAERTLRAYPGGQGADWRLRLGLAQAAERRFDQAGKTLGQVRPDGLSAADRAWLAFGQGAVADAAGDPSRAATLYRDAEKAGGITDLMRARFRLAEEEDQLRRGKASAEAADEARQNISRFRGTPVGYEFLRGYAVMLDQLGRRDDALNALKGGLATLPPGERARADDFRLLVGMIAGAGSADGRRALTQLLETGSNLTLQEAALQLLANASTTTARREFRDLLDRLIAGASSRPILEYLLLERATWALGDKDYSQAEADARALLDRFPASLLKAHALAVLTASAWDQRRYRTAADYAGQARAALPAGEARAELGVLVAEAHFRAGEISRAPSDFMSAADAYAAALRERPEDVPPGTLMFRRVQAMIEARSAAAAEPVVDELERDPAFDPVDRWKAEWNLARALQFEGLTLRAYARVNRLMEAEAPAAGLPAELKARMAWLQARLSLDAGKPLETLRLAERLRDSLAGIKPGLVTDILSSGALLRAQAFFVLGRESDALAALDRLRKDFPTSDAAVYSYKVQADHYATQDRLVEAQRLLIRLADRFPKNALAPFALYQAALLGERLGQDNDLRDAVKYLESLVTAYPNHSLVFYARLKEGDLLRKLNEFAQAEEVYRNLMDRLPPYPDVVYAELDLAACENAQSAGGPVHAERALNLYEDLCERADAPEEVRVEAGFNLGALLQRQGNTGRAAAVWWTEVVTPFLLDPARAEALDANGRYWMARTLVEYGDLLRAEGRYGQAADAWKLLLRAGLPFSQVAQGRLDRLTGADGKP